MTTLFRSLPSPTASPALSYSSHMSAASGAPISTSRSRPGYARSNTANTTHSTKAASIHIVPATPILNSDAPPVATNSALNKVASASSSLYQNCRVVLDRMRRVAGFAERFLDGAATAEEEVTLGLSTDPVSRSLTTLRLGSSLCYLFNALGMDHQLEINPKATSANLKACQRGTAHFIMACKQDLGWPDSELFAIHELYGQDTNGVVKVIHTVQKILDRLESQGTLLDAPVTELSAVKAPSGPSDNRTMIVREILDSERKYVQDLEVLQDYQRQVQANDLLPQDQIHALFLNLNTLADFQRRILIGVEANASRPLEEQRFGNLFLQMEEHFSVYEPYCANLDAAQSLAIAEFTSLSQLSHILDPISELAPLLIKPVQRICKYPLLLGTLLKNTPLSSPYHAELTAGHAAIMRVTERVNETKRREENIQAVADLSKRVEDWKGHDIDSFGDLLLHDVFYVQKNDSEREYFVYLFERIILCCKEAAPARKSRTSSVKGKPVGRKQNALLLKGRIFVNNVTGTTATHRTAQNYLEIRWRGDVAEEAFVIKCRSEEVLKQWEKAVADAVDQVAMRRRTNHQSLSRKIERLTGEHMSHLPAGTSIDSPASPASWKNPKLSHQRGPTSRQSSPDDDDDSDYRSEWGMSTPSSFMFASSNAGLGRSKGHSVRSMPMDYRDQALPGSTMPRPALVSADSSNSMFTMGQATRLRTRASQEQMPPPPANKLSRSKFNNDAQVSPTGGQPRSPSGVFSQPPPPRAPTMVRTRSASTPAESPDSMTQHSTTKTPTLLMGAPSHGVETLSQDWSYHSYDLNGSPRNGKAAAGGHKRGDTNSGGTLASQSSISTNAKRFSSSTIDTDRSSATSHMSMGLHQSIGATTVNSMPNDHSSSDHKYHAETIKDLDDTPNSTVNRIRIKYEADSFLIVAQNGMSYRELTEKVRKKLRLCGHSFVDDEPLRLRYQDEDGDKIMLGDDADLQMAFEDATLMALVELVLFASIEV